MRAGLTRLTTRAGYLYVRNGVRAGGAHLTVEARARGDEAAPRIGFTTSKKVGNAVARNRARRRLKEAARLLLPELGLRGADYVVVARPSAAEALWPALLDDLRNALIRLQRSLTGAAAETPAARPRRKPRPTEPKTESERP